MTDFASPYAPKRFFAMTFKWALIISLFVHLISLYLYTHLRNPDPIDIPSTEVKIKIGRSDILSGPPTEELPQNKNSVPNENTTQRPPSSNPQKTARTADKTQDLQRKKQQHIQQQHTKSGRTTPQPKQVQNTPHILDAIPQIARQTLSGKPKPVEKRRSKGKDTKTTPPTDGYERGTKAEAVQKIVNSYEEEISTWINSKKFLPKATKKKLKKLDVYEELATTLFIITDKDGNILQHPVIESSGYSFIDNLAGEIAKKASPLPPVPPEVPLSDIGLYQFQITLKFPAEAWQPSIR